MKHRERTTAEEQRDPLELWAGEPLNGDGGAPRGHGPGVLAAAVAVAVAALLAKYAVDVLLLLAALLVVALVLRRLGGWVARSDLLSPGWLLAIVLLLALGTWLFVPQSWAKRNLRLGRYVPKPVVSLLQKSQARGWATVAFLDLEADTGNPAPLLGPQTQPRALERPRRDSGSSPRSSASGAALVVSAYPSPSQAGGRVTLTARLSVVVPAGGVTAMARFYDGPILLGTSNLRQDGQAQVAFLDVLGQLETGWHEISAVVGLPGGGSLRSTPLRHRVTARPPVR